MLYDVDPSIVFIPSSQASSMLRIDMEVFFNVLENRECEIENLEIDPCFYLSVPNDSFNRYQKDLQSLRFHEYFQSPVRAFITTLPSSFAVVHYRIESDFYRHFFLYFNFTTPTDCLHHIESEYQRVLRENLKSNDCIVLLTEDKENHPSGFTDVRSFSLSNADRTRLIQHFGLHGVSTRMREVYAIYDFLIASHACLIIGIQQSTFSLNLTWSNPTIPHILISLNRE
jgi:hypothetical protein